MGELQKGGRKQEKKSEASMMDPASVCVCCELGKGGKKNVPLHIHGKKTSGRWWKRWKDQYDCRKQVVCKWFLCC